jgi:integrase
MKSVGRDHPLFPAYDDKTKSISQTKGLTLTGLGKILTNRVEQATKAQLLQPIPNLSSHSLRRGGASFLANNQAPDWLIKTIGRWKSQAFQLYTDYNWSTILDTLAQCT